MTTIAPPLSHRARPRTARTRSARTRSASVALRGAVTIAGVIALTVPAFHTLRSAPGESGVIAAATAFGTAGLLSLVVAWTIWQLARTRAPIAGVVSGGTLALAATTQVYASLTLLWNGTSSIAWFLDRYALVLAIGGVHLACLALTVYLLDGPTVLMVGLVLTSAAALAAVFPPGWYPQTSDAVISVTLGLLAAGGWMLWTARRRESLERHRARRPERHPA